jgi:hypothetical protein
LFSSFVNTYIIETNYDYNEALNIKQQAVNNYKVGRVEEALNLFKNCENLLKKHKNTKQADT